MAPAPADASGNVSAAVDDVLSKLGMSRDDVARLMADSTDEMEKYRKKAKLRAEKDTKIAQDALAPYANKAAAHMEKLAEAAKKAAETARKAVTEGLDGSREEFEAEAGKKIKAVWNVLQGIIKAPIKLISLPLTALKNFVGGVLGGSDNKEVSTSAQTEKELAMTFAKLDSALKKNLGMDLGSYALLVDHKAI